jgi:hypothetical protein
MILKFNKIYSIEDLDNFYDIEEFTDYNNKVCLLIVNERNIEVDEYYLDRDFRLFNNIRNIFLDSGYTQDDKRDEEFKFYILQSWR